jgi:RNA polymerase sigma-70 factor (ECF subfamily)
VIDADRDLVARARQGEHAAFGELVDRHRLPAYRTALAVLGSHAEAEDAAQDAFVLAWQRLDSYRGESSFRTWLLRIAWRQAVNRRRGTFRWWTRAVRFDEDWSELRLETMSTVAALDAGSTRAADLTGGMAALRGSSGDGARANWADSSPERLAANRELRRDIARAIRALSPKLRDTFLLAQSGDHTYEEIGALMNVAAGTIKWRVAEARRLVKQRLQQLGHGELG